MSVVDFGGAVVTLRISAKGVPHTIVEYRGYTFSICYMNKHDERGQFYRIWNYATQARLLDVTVQRGGVVNLAFVLDGLVEKLNLRKHDVV